MNGNHETMNVEGDFRYVDPGSYDECSDFLDFLDGYRDSWEEGLVKWIGVSENWKEKRKMSHSYWGHWNLVKVFRFFFFSSRFVDPRKLTHFSGSASLSSGPGC